MSLRTVTVDQSNKRRAEAPMRVALLVAAGTSHATQFVQLLFQRGHPLYLVSAHDIDCDFIYMYMR